MQNNKIYQIINLVQDGYKENPELLALIDMHFFLGNSSKILEVHKTKFKENDLNYISLFFDMFNKFLDKEIYLKDNSSYDKIHYLSYKINNVDNFDLYLYNFLKIQLKNLKKQVVNNNHITKFNLFIETFFNISYLKKLDINGSTFLFIFNHLSTTKTKPTIFSNYLSNLTNTYLKDLTFSHQKIANVEQFFNNINDFFKIIPLKEFTDEDKEVIDSQITALKKKIYNDLKINDITKIENNISSLEIFNFSNKNENLSEKLFIDIIQQQLSTGYLSIKNLNKINFSKDILEKHNIYKEVAAEILNNNFFFDVCLKENYHRASFSFNTFCKLVLLNKDGFLSSFDTTIQNKLKNKNFLNLTKYQEIKTVLLDTLNLDLLNDTFSDGINHNNKFLKLSNLFNKQSSINQKDYIEKLLNTDSKTINSTNTINKKNKI